MYLNVLRDPINLLLWRKFYTYHGLNIWAYHDQEPKNLLGRKLVSLTWTKYLDIS